MRSCRYFCVSRNVVKMTTFSSGCSSQIVSSAPRRSCRLGVVLEVLEAPDQRLELLDLELDEFFVESEPLVGDHLEQFGRLEFVQNVIERLPVARLSLLDGGAQLRLLLEFRDSPAEALQDRERAAGQHLLVGDHEEPDGVLLGRSGHVVVVP